MAYSSIFRIFASVFINETGLRFLYKYCAGIGKRTGKLVFLFSATVWC